HLKLILWFCVLVVLVHTLELGDFFTQFLKIQTVDIVVVPLGINHNSIGKVLPSPLR
ncbi:unnamed protein product, partial [Acanthoscelides obtectus]